MPRCQCRNSPDWFSCISLTNCLRGFDKRSRKWNFYFGDHFINSHNLFVWWCNVTENNLFWSTSQELSYMGDLTLNICNPHRSTCISCSYDEDNWFYNQELFYLVNHLLASISICFRSKERPRNRIFGFGQARNGTRSKKWKRGEGKETFLPSPPPPLFYSHHFSLGLWLSFLVLRSEATQKCLLCRLGETGC